MVSGNIPDPVDIKTISLFEIENFIGNFNKMVQTLKQAKTQQDEFIATLTHDLKVPLLAEQKAFELLSDYDLGKEKKQRVIESLSNSNKNLLDLINTLLDSYKIESGNFKISKKHVDLNNLINETITSLYPLIEEKKIKLELDLADDISLRLDKAQIARVLKNVVHNAIKNSYINGQISIESKIEKQSLKLIISDEGCGIAEDQLVNVFEKYVSDSQGLGLGLYISRLIVEEHEGTISIYSKINEGTSFEITLPLGNEPNE